jgi:hypothetical protein
VASAPTPYLEDWTFKAGDYDEDDCNITCGLDYDFEYTAEDLMY